MQDLPDAKNLISMMSDSMYRKLIWLFMMSCTLQQSVSQCTNAVSIPIPDNATHTIVFTVSGLINNNLSSPSQGICGIEIEFAHEYLGDLTLSLVSPAGTVVDLIGPTTTAFPGTNLSMWDIEFIPCASPAAPDPGFAAQWSNEQAWQSLAFYSGTYHPQSGCLEDFNTGPANGIWQLIIQDHDEFQLGAIESITLTFCDPTGLECQECMANAGTINPPAFSICTGENIQSSSLSVDFDGNIPPQGIYTYEYLLLSGNTILQSGSSFSITPPAGIYSICGLSYLTDDTTDINTLLSGADYNALSQAIVSGSICGSLTAMCVSVNVQSKPDTIRISDNLCNGEVFSFGGQNYTTTGLFYQVHDGPGLCDTIYEIRLNKRNLTVMIDPPDTLTCVAGSVTLSSSVSGASGPFMYAWTTLIGNITSPPDAPSVMVNQAGHYILSVTDGICDGIASTHVVANQGFPQVFISGGTITCSRPVVSLNPIYIPSDASIQWTGPSGFNSVQPNIAVSVPGTYIIRVTNKAGCTTSRPVVVGIDTATASLTIVPMGKDCQAGFMTIGVQPSNNIVSWDWTGPNSYSANAPNPNISDAGMYFLTATFANGCQRTAGFMFDGDFQLPDIMISPDDTLNCNEIITLTLSSMTPGVAYTWNGPDGLYSTQSSILVNQVGNFRGTVIAPNGCRSSDVVTIVRGGDLFDFQSITDTINCKTDTVVIGVIAPDADLYEWVNYAGPDTGMAMIRVWQAGLYAVMMIDTHTGCTVTTEIRVITDFAAPSFDYATDTITCTNPVASLQFIPLANFSYTSVHWELPDFTIVQGPTLMSSLPGEHRLIAFSPNGCSGTWRIHIPFDTLAPFLILEADTLMCEDTARILVQSLDTISSLQWSGPGFISSTNQVAFVDQPGLYHLEVFGRNGCGANYSIFVDSNYVTPDVSVRADSLSCLVPANLEAIGVPGLNYTWFDSGGQIISNNAIVQVTVPGQYIVEARGNNLCPAQDTIVLGPLEYPDISLNSDTLTCVDSVARISISTTATPATLVWTTISGDTISLAAIADVVGSGPFIGSVTGANGCSTLDTIFIPFDTIPPIALIGVIGEIRCQDRAFMLDGTLSQPLPLQYSWSSIGGSIVGSAANAIAEAFDTGHYMLVVSRLDNGCRDSASIHMMDHPDAITNVLIEINPTACNGEANGSILVSELTGGVEPILYQVNGGTPQSDPLFSGLPAGMYLLQVSDAEGCEYDTVVIIDPTPLFEVDAGPDIEIYLGETADLTGITNLADSSILFSGWDSSGISLCLDCSQFGVVPWESSTYTFQVTSVTGCVKKDDVRVIVIEKGKYFLPNIFSPNGDNINDEIRIHASPGIQIINQWVIFDRWGNAVYGKTNFEPEDGSVFWDGRTTTGEFANPGVFPYILEVQLINGNQVIYHGNITLLR